MNERKIVPQTNYFGSWEDIEFPKETSLESGIEIGDYTYYAGSYHGKRFSEQCVLYPNRDGCRDSYYWEILLNSIRCDV